MHLSDPKTNINKLRAEIGFVFQQFNLYPHLNVLSNITLAPIKIRKIGKREAQEQAMALLERVVNGEKDSPVRAIRRTAKGYCPCMAMRRRSCCLTIHQRSTRNDRRSSGGNEGPRVNE
jgi:hypothetical protein